MPMSIRFFNIHFYKSILYISNMNLSLRNKTANTQLSASIIAPKSLLMIIYSYYF